MYVLESYDGIKWKEISELPVLHSFVKSNSCKYGEVCFDTSPCLIKVKDEFIYFGRLNVSMDNRLVYIRKSKDLINWSDPRKNKCY